LGLAACGTLHWTKPGATAPDFARDSYACGQQHQEVSRSFAPFEGYQEGVNVNKQLYRACMQAKGYQRTDPDGWVGLRD
jgi:hypothetical protein